MTNSFRIISVLIIGAFIVIAIWSAHSVFSIEDMTVYGENGPLETLQAILLATSSLIFISSAVIDKAANKLILAGCSLLCLTFTLRELDAEKLDLPLALKIVTSGVGRNVIISLAFMALFILTARRFSFYCKAAVQFLRSKPGILLLLGGLFLLAGDLFEKSESLPHHVYFEEISELFSYCLLLLSAFATLPGIGSRPKEPAVDAGIQRKA
jgi:hypothetical protein